MKGTERKQSRSIKDFREHRLHRSRDTEEDDDKLDLFFLAGWLCIGGISYFVFAVLKGFIVQGVM